uniref:Cell division protein FtsH n=1 Tax=uncultured bacterium contig00087 TaxID=1181560 RepID=A0A806KH55_9BACT|nr:cell division protein FtsH [uncultured bacterium contig00087]
MQETKEFDKTNRIQEHEENQKTDFFTHINEIGSIAKQAGGINDLFYEFAMPHLEYLQNRLSTNQIQTVLFACLIYLYNGDKITITRLANFMNYAVFKVLVYLNEFEILEQKRLLHIKREKEDYRYSGGHEQISFELRFTTIDALRKGYYSESAFSQQLSIEKFFVQVERLCEERVQRRQSYPNTIKNMRNLLKDNEHLLFVKKVKALGVNDDTTLVLLRFFHYLVNMDLSEMALYHLEAIYDHSSEFAPIRRLLQNGNYILLTEELIESTCSDGMSDTENFRLTDEAKDEFLVELEESFFNKMPKGMKLHSSIAEKNLFYPEKTQQAINELCSLLQSGYFDDIQKRLSENGMRTGFACLFSGNPGTGKTETAHQIARLTGRDIMPVDISGTKSKWYGDSEKMIKGIFDKYRSCVKRCDTAPILLFNEADAVFSKRRLIGENNNGPAQTENAIQNIILNEIENLNGILIATTNLTNNFDTAFERRFLYKIEFEKPDVKTRKEIWRSLITFLSCEDACTLASRFDFSGGQIENISRKSTVHQVLSGKAPALEDIIKLCNTECLTGETIRKIGF